MRQLTAKSNELEQLMESDSALDEVKIRMKVFKTICEEFKECNSLVMLYLNEDEKKADQEMWFKPKAETYQVFAEKIDVWMKEVKLRKPMLQACENEVTHMCV